MNILPKKTMRAVEIWREKGLKGLAQSLKLNYRKLREVRKYQKWIREFDTLTDEDREKIRRKIESFSHKPLISVILPVYNIEEKWLRLCIESVRKQLYTNWELCIADDCSPSPHVRKILSEYAEKDERIKVVFREKNGHISAASNSALELASGEFSALLDHDDEFAEHALYFVAEELNRFPETAMIYSDEDLIDSKGRRREPKFKPDWSRDFMYSLNLITHLSAYRTETLRKIGGFRIGAEGSQDYDLALRVTEQISAGQIRHIPHILYHWRAIQGSVALSGDEKPYAHERAREAIRAHLERTGKRAEVSQTVHNLHRVHYDLPADLPQISLITTAKNENLRAQIAYEKLEILSAETLSGKSTAAVFNQLARKASGEILVFLDGDFAPQNSVWLKEIAGFALQKEIGAVGAKIFSRDETLRHAGIVLGINSLIGFAHRGLPASSDGYLQRARLVNNFSAVANLLATRREVFASLEGFDAENFPNGLFDVDFCLRARREKNLRVVLTPYAEILQLSDSSTEKILNQKDAPEKKNFKTRWKDLIENDSFYNPNLSLENERFEINLPPRVKKPFN
ncbi:MAG TPA: glycosyltransferase [Pyrinomonadaceae bacterium]|jgi:GT2 family glycosyltransferase